MQADVGEGGSDLQRRFLAGEIVDAKGGVMLLEQVVDFLGVPALIAKLENVTMSRRQGIKKVGQAIRVTTPVWRQLKENRA